MSYYSLPKTMVLSFLLGILVYFEADGQCTRTVSNVNCPAGFPKVFVVSGGLTYNGNWIGTNFTISSGSLVESGTTATLNMRVCGEANPGACMDIVLNLSGRTLVNSSPHLGCTGECLCLTGPEADWYYYQNYSGSATGATGNLVGFNGIINAHGGMFQIGTKASLYDNAFGGAGWFNGTNNASGSWSGDFNFNLSSCSAPPACTLALTASPGACNPTTNQYTLTGAITFTNAPTTGTLTVSVSGGGFQVFNAPFTSPQNYSISGLTSDGVSHTVTAVFSDDAACTANTTYTAPASCSLPGCNCTDMIYLNDETRNEVHKFSVDAGTGAISEIGSPWLPSSAGVTFPHGIAIDLNGFVYISHAPGVTTNIFAPWDNHFAGGKSYKLKSNGTVLNPDPAPDAVDFTEAPNEWGPNYGSENGYLYVPNNLNETVDAYDLCTGDYVGSMTVARTAGTPHDVMSWGFIVQDGNWYWSNIGVNKSVYTGSTDISLYNAGATNNGITLFNHGIPPGTVNTLLFDDVAMGITKDIAGNFYIIRGHINGTGPARIRKYGPTGVFISEISDGTNSGANTTNGVAGFFGARGIAYSKESGLLYVGNFENCVTVFDTNLVQQTALNIGNPTAGRPKGIGIITECCPNQTTMTETRDICYNGTPEKHFLQEVLSCGEGTITEGNWTEESNTSGGNITFNACDLSVTVSGSNGCATYRLQKTTPAGGNEQCGAFDISLTICASPAPLATVSGNQGTCTGSAPNNDATVNITSATNADQAGISTGATYTGPVYNGAGTIDISSGSGSFTNLIHNTQYTVRLFNGNNDCYIDTTLTTPNIICNICSASVNTPTTQCNNNGTPAITTDDWFSVTLTGTISNGSGNYVVKVGAYTSTPTASGTAITITGNGQSGNPLFQANGTSTYTLRIEDANDSNCFTTVTVGPVQSCSNCPDPNCFNITKQIIR